MADPFLSLLAAALLGGVIGWERESWQKPAGLRTHMMISLGAATFTYLAMHTIDEDGDPSRIIVGVATGIGFLGAGSIIQARGRVHGMTTAAGVWVVGAVGACCGAGQFRLALGAVILAIVILSLLGRLESRPHGPGNVPPP